METLRHAIEDYLYGLDGSLDLTMAAAHALARGIDSPALAELAGLPRQSPYEIRDLAPVVVAELSLEVAPLPDAVFRKAQESARAHRDGDLDFLSTAFRITTLMCDQDYLGFAERPDVGLDSFEHLMSLNEWLYAVTYGTEDDGWIWFASREDAERCFEAIVSALLAPEA
ncbi:hypothetical protein [Glycomyces paridis]|uniref:Uncharacterized protein n=1 Tax=Glycomyces paridis TaxID=2126555 RepID=A0A4V4HP58_9ACTN|nr:hypothetical protein [Glycomyces paridis]THV28746.1 hypothetical protein E9998_11640 [Glycomyces paridis]